jgi:hypothetical protein
MSYHIWEVKSELRDLINEKQFELSALHKDIKEHIYAMKLIEQMETRIDERKLEDPDKLKKELLDFSDCTFDDNIDVIKDL